MMIHALLSPVLIRKPVTILHRRGEDIVSCNSVSYFNYYNNKHPPPSTFISSRELLFIPDGAAAAEKNAYY